MFTIASAFSLEKEDAPLLRRLQWCALRGRETEKVGGRDIAGKQSYVVPPVILVRLPHLTLPPWSVITKRDRQL